LSAGVAGQAPLVPVDERRVRAIYRLARNVRHDVSGGFAASGDEARRAFVRRALFQRIRLNRAGLLRWRRYAAVGGDA
jgi:hypothetical protein